MGAKPPEVIHEEIPQLVPWEPTSFEETKRDLLHQCALQYVPKKKGSARAQAKERKMLWKCVRSIGWHYARKEAAGRGYSDTAAKEEGSKMGCAVAKAWTDHAYSHYNAVG